MIAFTRCTLFILLLIQFVVFGQTEPAKEKSLKGTQFGLVLNVDAPFQSVMPHMDVSGNFGFSIAQSPVIGSPFYIEFKALWGNYATEYSYDINYYQNGYWYPADATYRSGYQKYLLGSKIMAGKDFRALRFFTTPQIGILRIRTKTEVEYWDGTVNWNDQNDDGSENVFRTAQKQTGLVWGGEAGMEISLQRLFKKESEKNTYRLLISGSFLRGFRPYDYMNVDIELLTYEELNDHLDQLEQYTDISHPNVDEYQFAKTYTSPLQFWGINLGLTINF
jgi:hypothetical protein